MSNWLSNMMMVIVRESITIVAVWQRLVLLVMVAFVVATIMKSMYLRKFFLDIILEVWVLRNMVVAVLVFILNIELNKYPLEHSNFYIVYFFLIYDDFKKKIKALIKNFWIKFYISHYLMRIKAVTRPWWWVHKFHFTLSSPLPPSLSISNILVLFASGSLHIFSYATKRWKRYVVMRCLVKIGFSPQPILYCYLSSFFPS